MKWCTYILTVVFCFMSFSLLSGEDTREKAISGNFLVSHSQEQTIYQIARALQFGPRLSTLHAHTSKHVGGVFYRLPYSNRVLYLPPRNDRFFIGQGYYKKVYKALFFTSGKPELVAAAIGKCGISHEVKILKALTFQYGNPYRCSFWLSRKKQVLVLAYYNEGSILDAIKDHKTLKFQDRLHIAKDLVTALIGIHKSGYAHRDVHDKNILLHRTDEGVLRAGLVDFGRTMPLSDRPYTKPQGLRYRNPPEILLHSLHSLDQKAGDTFALGCCLYRLFFHKVYEGAFMYDSRAISSMRYEKRMNAYRKVQRFFFKDYFHFKTVLQKERDPHHVGAFKKAVLLMLHPDPKKRIRLSDVNKVLDKVLESTSY